MIKSKRWTLLGLNAFNDTPVMCIAIFAEIRQTILYETGMDLFAKVKSNACKDDFFEQNYVPNKLYTGGPTCVHKGNDISCVCR